MYIDFLLDKFRNNSAKNAMVWQEKMFLYKDVLAQVEADLSILRKTITAPLVVAVEADFSPRAVSVLLSLVELSCVVVPLTDSVSHKKEEYKSVAEVEAVVRISNDDQIDIQMTEMKASHPLIMSLKSQQHPGLILFSSGSTGKSKAAVHDFLPLLEKFKVERKCMRMLTFLLFDHIGGVNTLLYVLANAGCIITLQSRKPDAVCRDIERYKAEVLPTSPTFINLLLISEAYKQYDLSSLKIVTYGTEAMPDSTLKRFHSLFPNIRLQQTYGLSEIGIMRSKSKSSESLWVKVGGEGFETRVVNGILEIKAKSAMLGYLNAPSPFTDDGWFHTGDAVLVDGDYMMILGRESEIINVGGQKVYPAQVEGVLQLMPGVEDVAVCGAAHVLTGNIVKANIKISTGETAAEFKRRMKLFCKGRLENYQIPQKVQLVDEGFCGARFKKLRNR